MSIACNLHAFSESERVRYRDLVGRVRAAMRERTEISDGYVFRLSDDGVSSGEVAEWIRLELLCCPFLLIEQTGPFALTLTGPPGVKELIWAEFIPSA